MGASRFVRCIACQSKGAVKPQPSAEMPKAENTLLGQASLIQHRMARISVKEDSVDRLLQIANGTELQKALGELNGLVDLQITQSVEEKVVFTHSRWQDEASMKASEPKLADVLKSCGECFASDPEPFFAAGGNVQLSGVSLWTFKPSTSAETAGPSTEKCEVEEAKAVEEQQEPREPKIVVAEQNAVEEQQKPQEPEGQDAALKLIGSDEVQEVADDGEQTIAEDKLNTPPPSSWLFGFFGITCCAK